MKNNLAALLLALVAGGLVAAGCGGDDQKSGAGTGDSPPSPSESAPPTTDTTTGSPGAGGGGATTIRNPAASSGALRFDKSTLQADAGEVTLVMPNPSQIPHAIGVRGNGVDEEGDTVQTGGTSRVTATLEPGEYEFYCPVPGHAEGGMKGRLTVRE